MKPDELKNRNFEVEFMFSASKSGGPGGQNVNKVNTKVELRFNVISTTLFSDEEKELIFRKLKNKINNDGEIILVSQSERTQLLNKIAVSSKFYDLTAKALTIQQKRVRSRPTFSSKIKRLEEKRKHSYIKKLRKDGSQLTDG
jgi:ribosome-associated protein